MYKRCKSSFAIPLQVLNVDDLRSLTPSEPLTDKASHVSVTIPPPPSAVTAHDRKQQQSHRGHSSSSSIKSADLKVKASSTPAKPRKSSSDLRGVKGRRQKSFHFSDLDTSSESYDHSGHVGGVNHMLSSSTETTDFDRIDIEGDAGKMSKKRKKFEQKMKKKSSGLFTHSQQFGKHGGIQLLHLEPFDRDSRRDEGQLEQEFPGLAKALKQFNDSVAPRFEHFASPESKMQPAVTIKNMPLLQLPNMPDQAPPIAPPTQHPALQQVKHQSSTVGGKLPMPLLIIPNQPQPFSAHPVFAGGNSTNLPPPDSAHLPTTIVSHFTSQSSYHTSVPGPTTKVGRQTTFKSSDIRSLPHPTPSGGAQLSRNDDFKLPQIPVRPFVPILLPSPPSQVLNHGGQTEISHDPTSARPKGPQLLQLNDPLSRMKREGFKLLKEDLRDERVPELKLFHLEHGLPSTTTKEQGADREVWTNLPNLKTEKTHEQPEITTDVKQSESQVSSSGGSLTTITSTTEEGGEIHPHHTHGDKGERQVRTGRRQRGRRGKGVAWKMDQEESEKPQDLDTDATSLKIDGDVRIASDNNEVDHSLKVAPSDECTKAKSERQPLIGPSSGKTQSFPDEIPLQRLELRRLDMNASHVPNSPPPQGEENTIHVHTAIAKVTDSQSNDLTLDQLSSPARISAPQTNEIGIQVDPMPVEATFKEGGERKKRAYSSTTSDQATSTEPVAQVTVSSAIRVSPEHFSERDREENVMKISEQSTTVDSIDVTSVSSLDSEEVKVQLSDSADDDNNEGLPSAEQQNEFTPPPLWYNSRSSIPIPTKIKETDSPIPDEEEAPPTSPSLFAGFSATLPPPLPVPLSPINADSQQNSSPKSYSQSPVPEALHQQQPRSV